MAKGYRNIRRTSYRRALEAVMKAGLHAYTSRKLKKRTMRELWIARISAAARLHEMNYSTFMHKASEKGVQLDRRSLSELAIRSPETFTEVVNFVK